MGPLSLAEHQPIYVDANILIYSVERVAPFAERLETLWREVSAEHLVVVTSELTILESLVGPLKASNQALEARFRQALFATRSLQLWPVTRAVIERATQLRALYAGLKTPDALHAATALVAGCGVMLTNDVQLRQIAGLTVQLPHELPLPE
jgi:predicted nucleic acid-binding protein